MYSNKEGLIKAYENIKGALNLMHAYNIELNKYVRIIRSTQKIGHGSVLLRLTQCGKNCSGCPHIHWDYWFKPDVPHPKATSKYHPLELKDGPLRRTRGKKFPLKSKIAIKEALVNAGVNPPLYAAD